MIAGSMSASADLGAVSMPHHRREGVPTLASSTCSRAGVAACEIRGAGFGAVECVARDILMARKVDDVTATWYHLRHGNDTPDLRQVLGPMAAEVLQDVATGQADIGHGRAATAAGIATVFGARVAAALEGPLAGLGAPEGLVHDVRVALCQTAMAAALESPDGR